MSEELAALRNAVLELAEKYERETVDGQERVRVHLDSIPANLVGASLAQATAETYESVARELRGLL